MDYDNINEKFTKVEEIIQEVKEELAQLQTASIEPEEIIYPDILLNWAKEVIEVLDRHNNKRRLILKRTLDKLGYDEFMKQFPNSDYLLTTKTTKEIHADSEMYINNALSNRYTDITSIVGPYGDFTGLSYANSQLDGIVSGNGRKASVKSSLAGGYGIQDLHVRIFVKEV